MRRTWIPALAIAALATTLIATDGVAQISLGNLLPGSDFSVDGRRGTFLSQVRPDDIDNRILQEEAQGLSNEGDNVASYEGLQLRMPQVQARLDELLAHVDGGWPHARPRQPRTIVLASGEYAPMTFPDGTIAVRMGLLLQAESDDEVAYILAHELGHLRLGHFADDGEFRRKRQIATMLGRIYAVAIAASEIEVIERGNNYQLTIDDDRRVREQREQAAQANATLRQLMTLLMERPWARNEEDQADALAFDLIGAAGFAPAPAAPAVFGRLNADYELRVEASRHTRELLQHIGRSAMTQQNLNAVANGQGNGVLDGLRGTATRVARDRLLQVAIGYLGQRHRTPEARIEGISTYAARAYSDGVPNSTLQTDWLDDIRDMEEFRQARTVVTALQASKARESEQDLAGAIAALAPALDTDLFASSPIVANTAARLHGQNGDHRTADRLYGIGHASPDQSLSAYVAHAQLMADHRQMDRALEVVELGKARMLETQPDVDAEKPFLPVLVNVSFRQRRQEAALQYLQRCVAYEEDQLRSDCTRAVSANRPQEEEIDAETQARVNATLRRAEAQSALGGEVDGLLRGVNTFLRGGN